MKHRTLPDSGQANRTFPARFSTNFSVNYEFDDEIGQEEYMSCNHEIFLLLNAKLFAQIAKHVGTVFFDFVVTWHVIS